MKKESDRGTTQSKIKIVGEETLEKTTGKKERPIIYRVALSLLCRLVSSYPPASTGSHSLPTFLSCTSSLHRVSCSHLPLLIPCIYSLLAPVLPSFFFASSASARLVLSLSRPPFVQPLIIRIRRIVYHDRGPCTMVPWCRNNYVLALIFQLHLQEFFYVKRIMKR
jgi:hypothetical protein